MDVEANMDTCTEVPANGDFNPYQFCGGRGPRYPNLHSCMGTHSKGSTRTIGNGHLQSLIESP